MSESLTYCGLEIPTWLDFNTDKNGVVEMSGHFSTFSNAIIRKLKYNYTIITHDIFGDYGEVYGKNNATGYIGYLVREGEADLGFNTITPSYRNVPYFEFSTTMIDDKWIMITSDRPIAWKNNLISPVAIFSMELWIAYLSSLFILSITWTLIYNLIETNRNTGRSKLVNNWFLRIYHLIMINLQQSFEEEPGLGIGYRLFLLMCSLQTLWMSTAFSGGILSVLTVPPEPVHLETLKDVLEHFPQSQIFVMEDSPVPDALRMSPNEDRRGIYQQAVETNGLSKIVEFDIIGAFTNLATGKHFIVFPELFYLATLGNFMDCDLEEANIRALPEPVFVSPNVAFPIRKTLARKYQKPIKQVASSLFESGIFYRSLNFDTWVHRLCFSRPKNKQMDNHKLTEALSLKAFTFAMSTLITGLSLATILKIREHFQGKRATRRRTVVKMAQFQLNSSSL